MRYFRTVGLCLAIAFCAYAQSDRGTITGTVTDQTGAVVPSVEVVLKNVATGAVYRSVTTSAGAYTAPSLPAGAYQLDVTVPGFKSFHQDGINTQVAQTVRVDVALQVGTASESVEVHADATQLRTESAEQSTTIGGEQLMALPLYFGSGQGGGAIRNPLTFASLVPGAVYQSTSNEQIRVNGMPNQTFTILLEGQDATNGLTQQNANTTVPSMEAVEEFTLQSSNFAAEFGQVSGGLFNLTTKSGTNQFHGSAYEYLTNTALNAGVPFTDAGNNEHARPATHKNDWGFSVGGPVRIPKVYDGRNKTFFFFNYENYLDYKNSAPRQITVPTDAMRGGDFSGILDGRNLGTDPTGAAIFENTIYDPNTRREIGGKIVTTPFPGNIIPGSRIDPSAAKVQALIPTAQTSGNLLNFIQSYPNDKTQFIDSIKIDHNFGLNTKVSFYYGHQKTNQLSGTDGLPVPLTAFRDQAIHSDTFRLNVDHTITPSLLLHAGIGDQHFYNPDSSPDSVLYFDAVGKLGITGGAVNGMPRIAGLSNSFGGMSLNLGPTNGTHYTTEKPTAVASLTWVHGTHTYKAGAQFRLDSFSNIQVAGNGSAATGSFSFSGDQTGLPYLQSTNIGGGTIGNPYASFLLGGADSATVSNVSAPQWRRHGWAVFVQDTWKASRRLTLDYGLRWDRESYGNEIHYRESSFDPYRPNPSAGGLLGATTYEGYGPGRCNCTFAHTYPYGFGPRLGLAYQLTENTVLRAGWGITYGLTPSFSYPPSGIGVGFNRLDFTSSAYGVPAVVLSQGLQYDRSTLDDASFDPGIVPSPGQINGPPYIIDRNAGRPPRIQQWNISLQHQFFRDLLVEAAYVGNRGAWLQANNLAIYNQLSPERLASFGLDLNNSSDLSLLASPLRSPQVVAAGFRAPYSSFPTTLTLAQALRPFPQFGNIRVMGAPLGNSWYDSLQMKATKRLSRGLSIQSAFTWSKELTTAENAPVNNIFNRSLQKTISSDSQPLTLVMAFTYEVPAASLPFVSSNKIARAVLGGWTVGGMLRYASGLPIRTPNANNNLGTVLPGSSTFATRVPGEPLFLEDLNCHCFDPSTTFVLNPAAWQQPAPGQFGASSVYFNDYRYQRRPDEQLSLGRTFRIKERTSFTVRAEFFNVFNRTEFNDPSATNAQATQVVQKGRTASGFGYINTGSVAFGPRSGQLVGQLRW
jgi:hypothetical protein